MKCEPSFKPLNQKKFHGFYQARSKEASKYRFAISTHEKGYFGFEIEIKFFLNDSICEILKNEQEFVVFLWWIFNTNFYSMKQNLWVNGINLKFSRSEQDLKFRVR